MTLHFQQCKRLQPKGLAKGPVGEHGTFIAGRSFFDSCIVSMHGTQTVLSAFCITTFFLNPNVRKMREKYGFKKKRLASDLPRFRSRRTSKNSNYIGRLASQRVSIWWWSSGFPSERWRSLKSRDWSALFSKLHGASHAPRVQPPCHTFRLNRYAELFGESFLASSLHRFGCSRGREW